MSERSGLRLVVLQVLVLSLLATLLGRLWFLQVIAGDTYQAASVSNSTRPVVTNPMRGAILDDQGRALVTNRTTVVVTVDRDTLNKQPDHGESVLRHLAPVLHMSYQDLYDRTRLCTEPDTTPPVCWYGDPIQPIPVAKDVSSAVELAIRERHEYFPGVTTQLEAVREYPEINDVNAAHMLGYLGPATQAQIDASKRAAAKGKGSALLGTDLVGQTGLEAEYDAYLRGTPGVKQVAVNKAGSVIGTLSETDPVAGDSLVTSIDARVQAVAEQQLAQAIERARVTGDVNKNYQKFIGDSGAVVVMDVKTGRIVAMASYPTYDPGIWVGGISSKQYKAITSAKLGYANQSKAFQGGYAPGSIFKVISLPAAVTAGNSLYGSYDCPAAFPIGATLKRNYESEAHGVISLKRAIEVSCDTVFYKFAYAAWLKEGGVSADLKVKDPFVEMARAYGLGKPTGLDLPGEVSGRIYDRQGKYEYWQAIRADACEGARTRPKGSYLQLLDEENCSPQGYIYQAGEAANFAIGQGSTTVTPLQMAMVYSSVANGGTIYRPTIGKAIMSPDGHIVKRIKPKKIGSLPYSKQVLGYLQDALVGVTKEGTARGPFAGFPLSQLPVAAKTGTAEVAGHQSTSWFASYAPANDPQYAVVMMVTQGGTGSGVSGPSVAAIYKALFGVSGSSVNPKKAILAHPPTTLPRLNAQGAVIVPKDKNVWTAPAANRLNLPGPPLMVADAKHSKRQRRARRRTAGPPGGDG